MVRRQPETARRDEHLSVAGTGPGLRGQQGAVAKAAGRKTLGKREQAAAAVNEVLDVVLTRNQLVEFIASQQPAK